MEKLLIVGAGGFGRVVLEHARKNFRCFFIDDHQECPVDGTEIIGKISDLPTLAVSYKNLTVAIGNNQLRQQVFQEAEKLGYVFPNIICSSVYVSPHAEVGHGCIILNNAVIQNGAHCGNGVIINPGVELHHDSFVDDYSLIYTNSVIRSLAVVGKRAWIDSNITIGTGLKISDDEVVRNSRMN